MSMIPDKNRSRMRLIANSVGERGARWTSTATSEPNWRNSLTKQAMISSGRSGTGTERK